MATLLMLESWVHSTGLALPARIRDRGDRYVLVTRDPGLYPAQGAAAHPVVRLADEVVVAETNDPDAAVTAARAVAARRPVDGVVTTCDYYLATAATVATALGLPGGPPAALATATRKDLTRRALAGAGPANPGWAVVGAVDEAPKAAAALGYPLVVKPVDLNSGTGVRRVDDEASLVAAVAAVLAGGTNTRGQARVPAALLEELMTGPEVSVEVVVHRGRPTVVAVTDKSVAAPPAFVETGHMVPAALPAAGRAAVEGLAVAALDALGLTHGVAHVEVVLTPAGPRVVEVNPRQAGGYIFDLVHLVTGTHPLDTLVDLALGRDPAPGTVARPRPTTASAAGAPAVPTVGSAAVAFVVSPVAGTVERAVGADALDDDPGVLRWVLPTPAVAPDPVDNDAYLGHVLAVDASPTGARARAAAAVAGLRLRMADGRTVTPVAIPARPGLSPAGPCVL